MVDFFLLMRMIGVATFIHKVSQCDDMINLIKKIPPYLSFYSIIFMIDNNEANTYMNVSEE